MTRIRNATREDIKYYLNNYSWLEREITDRREEIIYPYVEADTNIGGGQSNLTTSPTERTSVKLADDIRLAQLERMKWAIDDVLNLLDDTGKQFVQLYYFESFLTIDGVALEIGVSSRTAKRLNTKIIMEIGERVGWI